MGMPNEKMFTSSTIFEQNRHETCDLGMITSQSCWFVKHWLSTSKIYNKWINFGMYAIYLGSHWNFKIFGRCNLIPIAGLIRINCYAKNSDCKRAIGIFHIPMQSSCFRHIDHGNMCASAGGRRGNGWRVLNWLKTEIPAFGTVA